MELKKIINVEILEKLNNDKISLELILIIFPELKNVKIFSKLDKNKKNLLKKKSFIFLISLLIINETDDAEYFFYKFNLSNKDKEKINIINNFYKNGDKNSLFSEKNLNKVFYFQGKEAVNDVLDFEIVRSKKLNKNLIELSKLFQKNS